MQEEIQDKISVADLILKIKYWINYLKTKWLILVLGSIFGAVIGFIDAYNKVITYTATLTFVLEDEKSGGGGVSSIASQFGFDLGVGNAGGMFAGGNLIELMKSRTVIEKALLNPVTLNGKEISLAEFFIQINGWRANPAFAGLQFLPSSDRSKYTLKQDSVLGIISQALLSNNLSVSQIDKKIGFITIQAKSDNELFAKYLVEVLAKEVSAFYVETKSKKAKMNLAILQYQSDSVRAELNSAISGVASANDNTYNLNPALNIKRIQSSKKQIDVQANTVILTELLKNLEFAKVTIRKETPLLQIIDRPILPLSKQKVSKLKSAFIGGFLGGFLALSFLIVKRWWEKNVII